MALAFSFVISILIQLVLPVVAAFFMIRRYKMAWRILWIGMLAYLVFQVAQVPVFQTLSGTQFYQTQIETLPAVSLALVIGLLTSILEQAIRTGGFWLVRKSIFRWNGGLTVAIGYAGIESALTGAQLLINFALAIFFTLNGTSGMNLSAQQAADLQNQMASFWSLAWYLPLVSAIQRVALMALQVTMGMMIWLVVTRKMWVWLAAAVIWQAAMNSGTVLLSATMPDWGNTLLFITMGGVNGVVLYLLYRKTRHLDQAGDHLAVSSAPAQSEGT